MRECRRRHSVLPRFLTLSLIYAGYSSFEALSYRWGVATVFLVVIGLMQCVDFRISRRDLLTVFCLSLFRATTSFSLVIAYQNIASGVASVIRDSFSLSACRCFGYDAVFQGAAVEDGAFCRCIVDSRGFVPFVRRY